MLRNFGILEDDPEPSLDLYFRQCSISVDCRDLSVMAATLANGGVNPVTGERAVRRDLVESVLSIMTTCGMYDYAGEWLYAVGMPAKSGVAGGILAVLPGQLGIGVFSPRLDPRGNSVRGVQVCRRLSEDFGLHFLRVARASQSAVRAQYALAEISSKRLRPERERRILDQAGSRARVYDLQGDLTFSAVEAVVRRIIDHADRHDFAILDLRRVTLIDSPASTMLLELLRTFQRHGKRVLLANAQRHPRFLRFLEEGVIRGDETIQLVNFPDIDPALEWCEDRLLEQGGTPEVVDEPLALAEHEICGGLSPDELAYLEKVLEYCSFGRGDAIIRKGDEADRMFFLAKGQVSVTVDLPSGQLKRLATLSPGMAFGEVALVDDAPRSADVRADGPVECYVLSKKAFDELGRRQPVLKMTLLENLLRNVSRMLTRANQEVATLAQ
jgi:glutaminase